MDELELRIASLELLFIELIPRLNPEVMLDASQSMREGLRLPLSDDERAIRLGAIELVEQGREWSGS